MMIGRTDEQQNPIESPANNMPQLCLDVARGTHLGRRHVAAYTGRTHDRFQTVIKACNSYLNSMGRPRMIRCCIVDSRGSCMAGERLSMRKTREGLRLRFA